MTEKDFKAQCLAGFSDPCQPLMIAETALRLAKKQGAKFEDTTGAWQCSICGFWSYGHADAREAPFGVCPKCSHSLKFYHNPKLETK